MSKIRFVSFLALVVLIPIVEGAELPPRGTNTVASKLITSSPVQSAEITAGMTREQVVTVLGKPRGSVQLDTEETLIYDKGDVVLNAGVVVRFNVQPYAVYAEAVAASRASGDKPWYSAITGMFGKKEAPAAVTVTKLSDLAPRFSSNKKIRWKVLFQQQGDVEGSLRLEGPEGFSSQKGQPFVDQECQCRLAGDHLEVQVLGYEAVATLAWVKLFKIVDKNTMICTDPKLFPGEMHADGSR